MNIQYLQQLISYYLMMEGEQWAILLYFLHSDNEIKLKQDIIAGLKNYVELEPKNIFLAHRQQKYSAIFKVSQNVGKKILELKEISVGGKTVNVKRYYFDYQLFVNKLPTDFTKEVLISYFSKFGAVKNVVLIPYVKMGINEDYLHCYIKFSQEASVQKVFSVHKLQINNKDFKAFRTYRIGQYEITDKRLQISLKQTSTDLIAFQNQVNQYFQKLGQLRERIRIQNHDGIYSGIITYTSQVHVNNALSKFDASVLTKGKDENISLKQFIYHKEQGGKVYVPSIIRNFDEQYIKKIFESYGQIIDFSTAVNKTGNLYNVTITYAKKSSAKVLIAQYVYNQQIKKLFQGKPHIQFFLNTIDRKNYSKYMNKSKNNVPKQPQFNAFLPQNPHIPNLPNMQNGPFIPQYQGFQHMMNPPFSQGPMIRPNPNIKN